MIAMVSIVVPKIAATFPSQGADAHKTIVSNVPDVCSNAGYSLAYIVVGVIPAALTLLIAIALRTGRTPARGGASEASLLTEAETSGVAGAL
jgi:hypothetical protein